MITPLNFYDLLEFFPKSGCAICNLLLRDVNYYLDSLLYEYVNDPATHRAFRVSRGLCNLHGWQLTRYTGNSLGTAILYRAAVDEVLKIIDSAPLPTQNSSGSGRWRETNGGAGPALAGNLEPTGQCVACTFQNETEKRYIQTLSQHIPDPRLRDVYRASDGLCLPHFRQLLREVTSSDALRQIVDIQRDIWTKLKAELEEFESKSGQDRRHEAMGAEGDSWLRAIGRMGGERGVFGFDRRSS